MAGLDPRMMMGGGAGLLQQGVGAPGGLGVGVPQNLMPPMQPGASPEQAMAGGLQGAMQDPRIAAYIRALSSGGGFGGMGR